MRCFLSKPLAVLSCLLALSDNFYWRRPTFFPIAISLNGIAAMFAIVVLCRAMRWLCTEATLVRSAQSWGRTAFLCTIIYLIPIGIFYAVAAERYSRSPRGRTININLGEGPETIFFFAVFLVPLIYFFVSTSRMKQEALLVITNDQQSDQPMAAADPA